MSNQNTAVRYEQDAEGVVTLTLDLQGRPMNVLDESLTRGLAEAVERIEKDAGVKGVIIASGKKEFLAGADIDGLFKLTDPKLVYEMAEAYKAILRRLEKCGRPVVAALNGTALGGGLELALACHYRVAIDNPKAKFGLPEVKLGLLPGGGGTQRLPRLIGIQASLPLMLEGKELRADQARQAGIIHEVVKDGAEMLARARAWIAANPKPVQPWDDKKFKWPGGDSKSPANVQMWSIAPSMADAKSQGNYPALTNIMSCVFEGGIVDFDTGCRIESRYFANLGVSQVSKNMIGTLWYQLNAINKGKSRPEGFEKSTVKKLGILGAGMMGAGIAYVSAKAGMEVVLLDSTIEAAEKGKGYSAGLLDKAIKKGRETPAGKSAFLDKIKATVDYRDLEGCDLVIEAVFEDRTIKAEVTKKTEAVIPATATFASNTSTLPITGLAKASARPEQFIGLHFFSPVDKMPLVEVIMGRDTAPATLARALDYVGQIRKTPIVVNDSPGFYTSRVFGTYFQEGLLLLEEGVAPALIENAARMAGMPAGPLAVSDEVSLELQLKVIEQNLADGQEPTPQLPRVLKVLRGMVREHQRAGRKAGGGFYDYAAEGKRLWPELARLYPHAAAQPDVEEVKRRLLHIQALETARCVEAGVVADPADADLGSILGIGFPAWTGGTLSYIDTIGLTAFVAQCEALAQQYGPRFQPSAWLKAKAAKGERFHPPLAAAA